MDTNDKYYKCPLCGNVIKMIEDSGVVPYCCGEEMEIFDC